MDGILVNIKYGDAREESGDVLVLKYAQANHGLDRIVVNMLERAGLPVRENLPGIGESFYVKPHTYVTSGGILFVGVPGLESFSYKEIREFARNAVSELGSNHPNTSKIIFTIHGANFGLDEIEAFEAQIAGIVDAILQNEFPQSLKQIVFVEFVKPRVRILTETLNSLFPDGVIPLRRSSESWNIGDKSTEKLRSAGYDSASKKRIFVAMPFAEDFDDIYHYGVLGAVKGAGYLCERADLESFTGDVMEWVKQRIKTADYVIADLTNGNANVYLEVGYAWGCNVPTILLVQNSESLKFDVRG